MDCHGVLSQLHDDKQLRFRCHTGHAYSFESLRAALDDRTEDALWNALRAVQERMLVTKQPQLMRSKSVTTRRQRNSKRSRNRPLIKQRNFVVS